MIAYVDASVLLRVVLGQPDALPEWRRIQQGVSSALVATESLRTLDRLRLRANLADAEVATRRATILQIVASLELVEIDAVEICAKKNQGGGMEEVLADLCRPLRFQPRGRGHPGCDPAAGDPALGRRR